MGSELRTERVEGHEGAEIGDVRLRIECRVGELGRVQPQRVRVVDRVAEQVGGGSGQRRVHLRRHRLTNCAIFSSVTVLKLQLQYLHSHLHFFLHLRLRYLLIFLFFQS